MTSRPQAAQRPPPKFLPGQTVITPAALDVLTPHEIQQALTRHLQGDRGVCDPEDAAANEAALLSGERLLAVYHTANQTKFWIITEADRSVTTVLLPDDY